jgi:hypothetical protein
VSCSRYRSGGELCRKDRTSSTCASDWELHACCHPPNGTATAAATAAHLGAYVERVAEANLEDDHQAASFATDPCHGLLCRRRWKRVTERHDSIRDRLATVLGRVNGTSATVEPRVPNPQDGADQRRGDIKVSKHGNTWILDVGVVCPAPRRPGQWHIAGEAYAAVKVAQ